jgi:hypothetical protein
MNFRTFRQFNGTVVSLDGPYNMISKEVLEKYMIMINAPQNITSRYTRNLLVKGINNEFHLAMVKRESHFIDKVWIANYFVVELLQGGLSKTGVGATPEQATMNCLVKYGVTFR